MHGETIRKVLHVFIIV